ncbi:vWA domain-containing protein [Spiroplasma chrysopicola]|uniref:Two-component regulator system yiem receptor component protein n=1 Tax=Spiroplasma chrysopicola DF-1 TaxID=1276227 RepID=R4U0R7_9MOLU|nr:two-component regulator system yiem receptor component protein [Spiroplasma chrysopicola]AGM24872.1 two-component regulator system yiem receptor component protein [Spiroplasma chrysopicola DF-1]
MQNYLEHKTMEKLAKKLDDLKQEDLKNPTIVLKTKSNRWLADLYNDSVNNFYDKELENELAKIPLPPTMEKEIYLFNWIKVNGYEGLKQNYPKTQDFLFKVNSPFYDRLNFYRYEFNKENSNPKLLFRDFISTWENILIKRLIDYRFAKIEEIRTKFSQQLYNRLEIMNKSNKLLKTTWNFFGKLWDPERILKKGVDMAAIEKFALFLETNPAIMEIATLLGRYQGESKLIEERILDQIVMDFEWQPIGSSPEEIIGATESKDLEHLFPAELVFLRDPVLKYIFYKKFIEGKLTTFEFISQDQVPIEQIKLETVKTRVPEEKGPIILSIDTSSSMQGSPEQIAKALALAIVKIAGQDKRPCYMINFSKSIDAYDLSHLKNSISDLVEFLAKSFKSDTDLDPALIHALDVMETNQYFNADLLVISDFMTGELSEQVAAKVEQLKQRRNRFHAILIGTNSNENAAEIFNNAWVYDPRDPFASERILAALTDEVSEHYNNVPGAKEVLVQIRTGKDF